MTGKIQQIIDDIRGKTETLHRQLQEERATTARLLQEIADLKSSITEKERHEAVLFSDIDKLKMELEAAKIQVQDPSDRSVRNREEDIDELVKEIEYCISQLKNKA
jgi:chromosome segregation ATPase